VDVEPEGFKCRWHCNWKENLTTHCPAQRSGLNHGSTPALPTSSSRSRTWIEVQRPNPPRRPIPKSHHNTPPPSYPPPPSRTTMKRAPNPPNTLIRTPHRPRHPPQLLPTRIPQQLHLPQYLAPLQIPHAHRLLAPVDVRAPHERVAVRPRRDVDFDLWVRGGEAGERSFEEGAVGVLVGKGGEGMGGKRGTYFMPRELPAQSQ